MLKFAGSNAAEFELHLNMRVSVRILLRSAIQILPALHLVKIRADIRAQMQLKLGCIWTSEFQCEFCRDAIQILSALQLNKLRAEIRTLKCSWNWAASEHSSFSAILSRSAIPNISCICNSINYALKFAGSNAAEIELHLNIRVSVRNLSRCAIQILVALQLDKLRGLKFAG